MHRALDNTMTPPDCAVNCQGGVKCFANDCFAVKAVFNLQGEYYSSLFVLANIIITAAVSASLLLLKLKGPGDMLLRRPHI